MPGDFAFGSAVQLPLVFLGGLLGSSHCIGMCGGFAVAVGLGTQSVKANAMRQGVWSLGRIATYTFGGAVAGYLGSRIGDWSAWSITQGALALLAGVLLVIQGLLASGIVPRHPVRSGCKLQKYTWLLPVGRMLRPTDDRGTPGRLSDTFVAGIVTGFLPCGLVYAYLALAAAGASVWSGSIVMLVFGLGTVPVMVATGVGASLLNLAVRAKVFRVAAWCVFATGVLTIGRGLAAFGDADEPGVPDCPMCDTDDEAGS